MSRWCGSHRLFYAFKSLFMFKIFNKKSETEKLQKKYDKLLAKWHRLSTTNRAESDKAYAQAQEILKEIERLQE